LFLLSVVPASLLCTVLFAIAWPPAKAIQHLAILASFGCIVAWAALRAFGKIPFTCAWQPGKTLIHMAFLGVLGVLFVLGKVAWYETRALGTVDAWAGATGAAGVALFLRWFASRSGAAVKFDDPPAPAVMDLGLHRDGVLL